MKRAPLVPIRPTPTRPTEGMVIDDDRATLGNGPPMSAADLRRLLRVMRQVAREHPTFKAENHQNDVSSDGSA